MATAAPQSCSPAINRNMRCIEILSCPRIWQNTSTINRNMRCIEIEHRQRYQKRIYWINRNMRCIEILVLTLQVDLWVRLIET